MRFTRLACIIACISLVHGLAVLKIEEGALAFTTDTRYLSYNVDAQILPKFGNASLFHDKRFIALMGALTPCWVRLGGTQGDHNVFQTSAPVPPPQTPYTLAAFERFCSLSSTFNLNFTFGLNLLLRQDNNGWDSSNAKELMENIKLLNQEREECRVHFELGDEPDLYFSQGYPVNESQLADDFATARTLIDGMQFRRKAFLFGPDVASPLLEGYLERFLKSVPSGVLDGVSYHHFYDQVEIANPAYSYDPLILDKFLDRALYALMLKRKYQQSAALVLGESADYTAGGADNISNTYLTGFMFLDSLGVAAALNHSIYFKQSLFGTQFSSLLALTSDLSSASPNPAYWIALIFRRLLSNRVLAVTGNTARGRQVRMYAHCLNGSTNGSVAVYLMNLDSSPGEVQLSNGGMVASSQHWYLLSSGEPGRGGRDMYLNGKQLVMSDNHTMPAILPDIRPAAASFQFPSRQYGFIVFPDAKIKPCTTPPGDSVQL